MAVGAGDGLRLGFGLLGATSGRGGGGCSCGSGSVSGGNSVEGRSCGAGGGFAGQRGFFRDGVAAGLDGREDGDFENVRASPVSGAADAAGVCRRPSGNAWTGGVLRQNSQCRLDTGQIGGGLGTGFVDLHWQPRDGPLGSAGQAVAECGLWVRKGRWEMEGGFDAIVFAGGHRCSCGGGRGRPR